jgi:hypothetical protein
MLFSGPAESPQGLLHERRHIQDRRVQASPHMHVTDVQFQSVLHAMYAWDSLISSSHVGKG